MCQRAKLRAGSLVDMAAVHDSDLDLKRCDLTAFGLKTQSCKWYYWSSSV